MDNGAESLRIVGHRGAMGHEPENTLRSFRRAVRDGADAVELDVRLSKDRELVICHDAAVDRTTNGSGAIADLTVADLAELDAGEGERVPTFGEVLSVVDGLPIQAEVKAVEAVPVLAEMVRERRLLDQVIVTSFHLEMLAETRRLLPEVPLGLIFDQLPEDGLDQARAAHASLLCPGLATLTPDHVAECRAADIEVCAWLVNDEDQIGRAIELGVAAVTSDVPGLFRRPRTRTALDRTD